MLVRSKVASTGQGKSRHLLSGVMDNYGKTEWHLACATFIGIHVHLRSLGQLCQQQETAAAVVLWNGSLLDKAGLLHSQCPTMAP